MSLRTRPLPIAAAAAVAVASVVASTSARAEEIDPASAKVHVEAARADGFDAFCTHPPKPLLGAHRGMCDLASEVKGCEALVAACKDQGEITEPKGSWVAALASIAQKLVWLLVAVGILAIAYPILRALRRMRADRSLADLESDKGTSSPIPKAAPDLETISDAEAALRAADDLANAGELERAMSLYLAASLVALDRRGAVRLAKHRTNGEYVRLCTDPDARLPLREIVREVDKIEFGGVAPTADAAQKVSTRARALVRRAAGAAASVLGTMLVVTSLALVSGCNLPKGLARGADPMGDELPREVLRRSGYVVARPESSLATLPIPTGHLGLPVVVVDPSRVPLDDEARAHLLRWVEAGGVLVLFGTPSDWPRELGVKTTPAGKKQLEVELTRFQGEGRIYRGALVAKPTAITWKDSEDIGRLGDDVYVARQVRGAGAIVGVAGNDLFTNVGAAIPENGTALVAILEAAREPRPATAEIAEQRDESTMPYWSSTTITVAHEEDGISPPGNPFSSLVQAGLGKGLWHALGAALVLFLAYGIRHAKPRPTPAPARRSFSEHVEATGAFYRRTRAFAHALAAYGRFAELRVRERLPRGADPVAFLAKRANASPDDVSRVWTRAMEAKPDDPVRGDELATIKDLRALLVKAL